MKKWDPLDCLPPSPPPTPPLPLHAQPIPLPAQSIPLPAPQVTPTAPALTSPPMPLPAPTASNGEGIGGCPERLTSEKVTIRDVRGSIPWGKLMINSEIGLLREVFEFLVDTGADRSCIKNSQKDACLVKRCVK